MKKFMVVLLVLILSVSVLAGCTSETKNSGDTTNEPTNGQPVGEEVAGEIVKVGLGHITSIGKSKDLDGETAPVGQVDTTIVAAGFDAEGKVVSVTIDVAQTKVNFDTELQLTSDVTALGKTKVELGDEYGMKKASQIEKEWYEQATALEEWMTGKTIEEIKAMDIVDGKSTEADLTSSVTISVEGYIAAIEEAYNNAVEFEGGATEVGLGTEISIAKSKSAEGENGAVAQVDNTMTVVAIDGEGHVVKAIIDVAQTKINFDTEGKITTDKAGEFKTKVELGDEYGMKKASQIEKEWYEQAVALAEWFEGKSIDEIMAMEVAEGKTTEADLTSSVTVSVGGYLTTIEKAVANAK